MVTITKKNQQTNVAVSLEGDVGKQFEQIKF
jgi:hypothetical protein